ncbi:MAG: hypothetical protein WC460_03875 [Patescibacteria group bacterium]
MPERNYKIENLGNFQDIFFQVLKKNNVEAETEKIFDFLVQTILGRFNVLQLSNSFESDLNLDFETANSLAYDLKIKILDKKSDLDEVKNKLQGKTWQKYSPLAIADEFLAKLNYSLKDENKKKRYYEAILSWLKEVRDLPELKDILTRSEKIGGIGMSEEVFNRLYDLLVAKKEEIRKEKVDLIKIIADYELGQKKETVAMPSGIKEEEIDVSARPKQISIVKENPTGGDVTIDHLLKEKGVPFEELAQKEEIKRQLGEIAKIASKPEAPLVEEIKANEEFIESRKEIEPPAQTNYQLRQPVIHPEMPIPSELKTEFKQPMVKNTDNEIRPKLDDVKFTPQLYGPVDELGAFKIEDLRRLSKDPQVAVQKIKSKIELLEDDSLVKRNEGLKALKNSPLYKAYAEIMNTAIKEGKSFAQVIAAKPIMTLAEFKAVMDLNKSLKY